MMKLVFGIFLMCAGMFVLAPAEYRSGVAIISAVVLVALIIGLNLESILRRRR